MLVPTYASMAALEAEAAAAAAWAAAHGWTLRVDIDNLWVEARTIHPADGDPVILLGAFNDYRVLAPDWRFADADGNAGPARAWPRGGSLLGQGSIFHSVGVICAHFSRRAYREHGGPHQGDWGSATRWLEIDQGARATTLADMLSVIGAHLSVSPGRMG
jgi:hypothetical protein